jgi:hypothetical protein
MSYAAPSTGLPFSAQVELAAMGDGLKRWARLSLLAEAAEASGSEETGPLKRALEAALPEAETHAEALVSFYVNNAEAVNAMLGADSNSDAATRAGGRAREEIGKLGGDPAAGLATNVRGFLEAMVREEDDGLCKALFNLMLEAYVCCLGGVEASCGTLWGDLYERHCN